MAKNRARNIGATIHHSSKKMYRTGNQRVVVAIHRRVKFNSINIRIYGNNICSISSSVQSGVAWKKTNTDASDDW